MKRVSEKNNFIYLLVSLVFLLLAGALVSQFPNNLGQIIFQAVTVITLASSVLGLQSSRLWFRTVVGFIVSVLLVVIIGVILEGNGMSYIHLILLLAMYVRMTWFATKQVLFTGPIDGHKIVGAICIYLLMGLVWAMLYLLIAQFIPGAFHGLEQAIWYENFSAAAYYSYVTLTTLGYGDISPVEPIAQFLVYMEAIVGVFYMAILVASLIGVKSTEFNSK